MNTNPKHSTQEELRDRSGFAREWLSDARAHYENKSYFSSYFSAYVALVAASTQFMADSGKSKQMGMGKKFEELIEITSINKAMKFNAGKIDKFLSSEEGKLAKNNLRMREVPGSETIRIIGDGTDEELREAGHWLYQCWSPLNSEIIDIELQAQKLALIFRKVRNRLFHGEKAINLGGSDADLLERLNPILFGVVESLLVH